MLQSFSASTLPGALRAGCLLPGARPSFHALTSQACYLLEVRTIMFWTLRFCIPLLISWHLGIRPCMQTATSFLVCNSWDSFDPSLIHIPTQWNILWNICTRFSFSLLCHTGLLWDFAATLRPLAVGYALASWVLGSQPLAVLQSSRPVGTCFIQHSAHPLDVSSSRPTFCSPPGSGS